MSAILTLGSAAAAAVPPAADPGAPVESQRRAAALADIGRLRVELGAAEDLREALAVLEAAARLDPACIRARFWLGTARLRSAGPEGGGLDPAKVVVAGQEFEAVFRLSELDRSPQAQDLRRRAMEMLDACASRLPSGETRFGPWWRTRRQTLLDGQASSDTVHTVAPGDTFGSIARRYYGDAGAAGRIARANPGADPRRLTVGQHLTVPAVLTVLPRPEPDLDGVDRELLTELASAGDAAARRSAAGRLALRDCVAAVPALAESLRADPSQWVRAECARALGRLGQAGAEPALCAALAADGSVHCRAEAAAALGRLGQRSSSATLLQALADPSPGAAAAAARALGAIRPPGAAGPLLAALSAPAGAVRRAAAFALIELASARQLTPADARRLRELAAEGAPEGRAAALLALAGAAPAAAAGLLGPVLDESGPAELRRAAGEAAAMLAAGRTPLTVVIRQGLPGLLGSDDPALRLAAAAAVARMRRDGVERRAALEALAGLLDDERTADWGEGDPQPVCRSAARVLAEVTGQRLPPEAAAWRAWLERQR